MPNSTPLTILLAAAMLAAVPLGIAGTDPGRIDLPKLYPAAKGGTCVQINLPPSVLRISAAIVGRSDPHLADIIRGLHHVQVHVTELDNAGRESALDQIASLQDRLEAEGWVRTVEVREGDGTHVGIHLRLGEEDRIYGLVVTVVDAVREVIVVNIAGSIHPEQLAAVAERLPIEPLRRAAAAVGG